jgi:hypothetical protein
MIEMNSLTNDILGYLIEIVFDNNKFSDLASLLVSRKIKLISNIVINNKLKRNYKIIIRNNNLLNPLQAYNNIYKIYENKFVIDNEKISELLELINNNKNFELFEILCKTIPKTIRSSEDKPDSIDVELKNNNFNKSLDERIITNGI